MQIAHEWKVANDESTQTITGIRVDPQRQSQRRSYFEPT